MQNLSDEVFYLGEEDLISLPARSMRVGLFGKTLEDALQTLLERHPEILPGRQIDPASEDPPRFALLRREVPVGGGEVDHLLVDQRGVLTLVETKLLQNPESKREVIGQIIEYAANASESWGEGKARRLATDYWRRLGKDLDQVLREKLSREIDEGAADVVETLWNNVEQNLRLGRVRLIIVTDELRPEVRRMVEYLNREMQNAEVLGLELRCYGNDASRLVLVPRLVGQIQNKETPPETIVWTPERLQSACQEASASEWGGKTRQVLNWALANGAFLEARTQAPAFAVRGRNGTRLASFFAGGGVYVFLADTHFVGGASERDQFVRELKELRVLNQNVEPEAASGRNLAVKLTELDENGLAELLAVFGKHC